MMDLIKFTLPDDGFSIIVSAYGEAFARADAHRYLLREGIPNDIARKVFDADPERMDYIFAKADPCPFCGSSMKLAWKSSDSTSFTWDTTSCFVCESCEAQVETRVIPPEEEEQDE